jgi:hypothetical protein
VKSFEKGGSVFEFMDETQQSGPVEPAGVPRTSLAARLMNVYVAPGEVFAEVKDSPPVTANWAVPMVIAMIAGIIYSLVVFSQPAILQGMKEAAEKPIQEQVAAGKKTQQEADKQIQGVEMFMTPTIMKAVGAGGSILGTSIWLFFCALIVWLIGRFGMQGEFSYMRAVEVAGLSAMISALGGIVGMLLAVIYGNTSMTAGPVLLVGHFDTHSRLHNILKALDVMTLWYLAVLSVGVGTVTGKGSGRAAVWIFGVWAVIVGGLIFLFVKP